MLLVTGITGHSGKYFLEELIKNKYEGPIRCAVRETSDTSLIDNSGLNIEKVVGTLDDIEFIRKAMDGVDIVMHIYNIHHSPAIVQAAIENNVKRAILVHTTGIYSNFKYASQGYMDVENKVAELTSGIDCLTKITILRPTMIYGDLCDSNMSKFIKMIDKFRIMPVIDGGKSLIQPVNKLISDYLNKKTIFISIPLEIGVFIAKAVKAMSIGKIDYVEKVQRMGEGRSYSNEKARLEFAYEPMRLSEGIRIEVEQYLEKKKRTN